jgi:hypothetical protein
MRISEFGKCHWNSVTFGRLFWIPVSKFDRIRPKWPDSGKTLPHPAGSMARSVQIQLNSGQLLTMAEIRQYFGQFQAESGPPASGDGGRMSSDSNNRMLSDSDAG